MRTPESLRSHEEKIERCKQGHEERKKLLGRPGPRHNTYMKARREAYEESKHAGKS
jgi:hypothetical protein